MLHTIRSIVGQGHTWNLPQLRARRMRQACWLGRPQWLVCFGRMAPPALPAAGDPAPVRRALVSLDIDGVDPAAVYRVQITCGGRRLFDIGAYEGRSGHVSSAGEILKAMAAVTGGAGMSISGAELDAAGGTGALTVRLCLLVPDAAAACGARVRARLR